MSVMYPAGQGSCAFQGNEDPTLRKDRGAAWGPSAPLATDRLLKLRFRHFGSAGNAFALGFLVQLIPGSAAGSAMGTEAAPSTRREVIGRRLALGLRFAVPRAFLVHRPCGN